MKILIFCVTIITVIYAEPFWINNPTNKHFIGGVGIVKGKENRRIANIKARAELLEGVKVSIKTKLTSRETDDNGNYSSYTDKQITQKAQGSLEKSYIKATYSAKDGYYYVWMVIDK